MREVRHAQQMDFKRIRLLGVFYFKAMGGAEDGCHA